MHRYEKILLDLCQLLIEEYLLEKKKNIKPETSKRQLFEDCVD